MALVMRSNVTLSAPRDGSLLLPDLGVSGMKHRWHAEAAPVSVGKAVTSLPDSVGKLHLNQSQGTVMMRASASGQRYLDLSATGDALNRLYRSNVSGESNTAFTLAGLIYWTAGESTYYGVLSSNGASSTQAISVNADSNRIAAYSGGLILQTGGSSGRGGWHTAVVTYRANGADSISLDGGSVATGEVHNVSAAVPVDSFGINGKPTTNVRMIDFAFFNRALSAEEHSTVHATLAAQIPA